MVGSGEECIERFVEEKNQGNKIHLVLLDYRLGDMFGNAVAKKIGEYYGTIIILISAYDLDYTTVKELEENKSISKYIEKPIRLPDPMGLVADTIDSRTTTSMDR